MNMFPPFLALLGMALFAVVTITGTFLNSTGELIDSRLEQTARVSDLSGTSISLEVAAIDGATVTIDVLNTGRVPLRNFAAWNVWADFHDADNTHYSESLAYTSAATPGVGEWAVDGIYLDPTAGVVASNQPGILDPGETVRIVFRTSPGADELGTNALAIATPNGVHARTVWRDWVEMASAPANVDAGGALAGYMTSVYALRGDNTSDFWAYDTSGDSWTAMVSSAVAANGGAALAYADVAGTAYVYALFGGGSTTFQRYNIDTNTWQARSSTVFPIEWGGSLAWDGGTFIYAIGGDPIFGLPLAFWRYNVDSNLWSVLPNVPEAIDQGAALAFANEFVYMTPGGGSTNFYAYDVADTSWAPVANVPTAVAAGGSLHAVGNNLYALAGNGASFWRYQTTTDEWVAMTEVPADVGAGGALTYTDSHFWALKGDGTPTFWRY